MYKHGVYVSEQPTSLTAPISGTAGLQVIFGTAPVNLTDDPTGAVNKPKLCHSFKEAVAAVGYSDNWDKFTLCQSIYACFNVQSVSPIILVNVLDPAKHKTTLTAEAYTVIDHQFTIEQEGILKDSISLKVTASDASPLTENTDYVLSFNDSGNLVVTLLAGGNAYTASSIYLAAGNALDPTAVTYTDIIGTASGNKETGLQLVRQIYPTFGMTPVCSSPPAGLTTPP